MEENIIIELYEKYTGEKPSAISEIPQSGSSRRYFMLDGSMKLVGTIGTDRKENEAFVYLSDHFCNAGLPVPKVVAVSDDGMAYLQTFAGSRSLFDAIQHGRSAGVYSEEEASLLRKAVTMLPAIQITGARDLDFTRCYPVERLGRRDVMWDLNYFKYCYLKPAGIEFNEAELEDDYEVLAGDIISIPEDEWGFLIRDYQSRNILISDNGDLSLIDFQGGRRGPIYYDLVSLLWQAKARIPAELRNELIDNYFDALEVYLPGFDRTTGRHRLRLFVLFRTLQVLGAYGFRGIIQKKSHFLESIPMALSNLSELLAEPFERYPYLSGLLASIAESSKKRPLTVTVTSFSYKKGIPADESGNGGGFVFDCRAVHNPGRYEQYKMLTGLDAPVIKFLEENGEINDFLTSVYSLVDASVKRYLERGFSSLCVNFGCTGGRHRSVYSAEHLAAHLNEKFGVAVNLVHREQGINRYMPSK